MNIDGTPVPIESLLDEEDLAVMREDADEGLQIEFGQEGLDD